MKQFSTCLQTQASIVFIFLEARQSLQRACVRFDHLDLDQLGSGIGAAVVQQLEQYNRRPCAFVRTFYIFVDNADQLSYIPVMLDTGKTLDFGVSHYYTASNTCFCRRQPDSPYLFVGGKLLPENFTVESTHWLQQALGDVVVLQMRELLGFLLQV